MDQNKFNQQQNGYYQPNQGGYYPPNQNPYNMPPQNNGAYYPPQAYYDPTKYYPPSMNPNSNYQELAMIQMERRKQSSKLIKLGIIIGTVIVAYLIMQVMAVTFMKSIGLSSTYETSALFQNCFNMVGVHFMSMLLPFGIMALVLKKEYKSPLIPTEKVGALKGFTWIGVGMGGCMAANFFTNFVITYMNKLGYELTQGEILDPDSTLTCIVLVFSTAIIPGIIEEFALRCCTLGVLKNYGKGFGVFAVSVVFGLLHGNVIQFIFAFIVGLVLGYITIKTNNVLLAMTIHACNNGMSVIQDIVTYAASEKISNTVVSVIYYVWIAIAIGSLIYLANKKELLPKKEEKAPKSPSDLSFGAKLACLIPGFFIPFLLLIALTATTVTKIK